MKTIRPFYAGLLLFLSFIFFACNSEFSEIVEPPKEVAIPSIGSLSTDSLTRALRTTDMRFDPAAMKWWSTHKGTGPGGGEHNTYYMDHSVCDWTLDTCKHYILIQSSYDMGKIFYMQIQYRFLPQTLEIHDDLIPESSWHFLGEEYAQDEYPYGIIKLECKEVPEVEVNAHAFPKGRIGIRYRVFGYAFPGHPDPNGNYNTNLISDWTYTHGLDYCSNDYGYVLNPKVLTIHVNFPKSSSYVTYSTEISIEDGESVHTYNSGTFVLKKVRPKGTYSVITKEISSFSGPLVQAHDFGYYDESINEVYTNFDIKDFREMYP